MVCMRSRLYGIWIFALIIGVALLTLGVLLPQKIAPTRPIPLELADSTVLLDDAEATVGEAYPASGGKTVQAPVRKQFNVTLGQPADEQTASAKVGVTTTRTDMDDEADALLDAQVWSFTMDRISGEVRGDAQVADTPATPPTTVSSIESWTKFPQNLEQRDYQFFDYQLRENVPATFQGTIHREDANGNDVELYQFMQEIPDTDMTTKHDSIWNTTTVDRDGQQVEARLHYSGTRKLQVDPVSGVIISVEESLDSRYEDDNGERVADLLVFNGKTTDEVERSMLLQAQKLGENRSSSTWGLVLTIVGAIVTAASLIGLVVNRRKQRKS